MRNRFHKLFAGSQKLKTGLLIDGSKITLLPSKGRSLRVLKQLVIHVVDQKVCFGQE